MSIYKGTTLVAGTARSETTNKLFQFGWFDYELADYAWLRADTFSWHDGRVYSDACNHLINDYETATEQTETIGSYTITYYLAPDGHKIVLLDQMYTLQNIYNESGVAWYYILDTANQRFKLPRTKFGFTGLRDGVGKYIKPGLPNITGQFNTGDRRTHITGTSGAIYNAAVGSEQWGAQSGVYGNTQGVGFDASRSSSIYGNANTVQPPATQMYLYFYVGQFTQTAILQSAGITTAQLNNKLDLDGTNATAETKKAAAKWLMPDYTAAVSINSTDFPYTVLNDGYIDIAIHAIAGTAQLYINSIKVSHAYSSNNTYYCMITGQYRVSAGDIISFDGGYYQWAAFYPLLGV